MTVAVLIKLGIAFCGLLSAILAFVTLVKRQSTPVFSVIWVLFGCVLILTGIFIEPYNWDALVGVPTLAFCGLLLLSIIILFWYITKKIDELQHKFNEMIIQLTLIRDENSFLKNAIDKNKESIDRQIKETATLAKAKPELFESCESDFSHVKGKNILFVNNTLSIGGAEKVLITIMRKLINEGNTVHLFVVTGMGELAEHLPEGVQLLNQDFIHESVATAQGKKKLSKKVLNAEKDGFAGVGLLGYQARAFASMAKNGKFHMEKIAWRVLSETAPKIYNQYDIAVAFTEGAATYYVSEYVSAKTKYAFVHTPYESSGYTKQLDRDAYDHFNKIYAVSEHIRKSFLRIHPECINKVYVRENEIDYERIRQLAEKGFGEVNPWNVLDPNQIKILTVEKLKNKKPFKTMIETALRLRESGLDFVWIVLGEGDEKKYIQNRINKYGLQNHMVLMGDVKNTYAYMRSCDIYVHASEFEGKSVAVREAKALGAAIILANIPGNEGHLKNGVDGLYAANNPDDIENKIIHLLSNPEQMKIIKQNAWQSVYL